MPMLPSRMISTPMDRSIQMKRETLLWPPLPALPPNPLSNTPSSARKRNIAMFVSKNRCCTPSEDEVEGCSPLTRASPCSVVVSFNHTILILHLLRPLSSHLLKPVIRPLTLMGQGEHRGQALARPPWQQLRDVTIQRPFLGILIGCGLFFTFPLAQIPAFLRRETLSIPFPLSGHTFSLA